MNKYILEGPEGPIYTAKTFDDCWDHWFFAMRSPWGYFIRDPYTQARISLMYTEKEIQNYQKKYLTGRQNRVE